MDLSTFQAVAVTLLVILPGAIYTWAYEQQTSASKAAVADRLIRLFGASTVFLVAALPGIYQLYRTYIATGVLDRGEPLPPWIWVFPPLLIVIPWAAGVLIGRAARLRRPWVKLLVGPAPANRAWDQLFSTPHLTGWVRLKLTDDKTWVWGVWARDEHPNPDQPGQSYAAGYPETQDLYFVDTGEVDENGKLQLNEDGTPRLRGVGLLIRWDQVAYAEYIEG